MLKMTDYGHDHVHVVDVDVDGFRSKQRHWNRVRHAKNVEFCSLFFAVARQTETLKIIWKQTSESTILKTGYVHDHVHTHVDDHVLVIVVVDVNVIVVLDGFVSQPGHWNKVRHE